MFLIHPTSDLAYSLRARTLHYFQEMGIQTTLDLPDAMGIVKAMLDDAMSHRFIWCKPQETVRKATLESLRWTEELQLCNTATGERTDIFEHYFTEVLDDYEMMIHTWLDHHMPRRTWDVWHLTALGRDLVLDKGSDYRILDWERRMKSGEWRL